MTQPEACHAVWHTVVDAQHDTCLDAINATDSAQLREQLLVVNLPRGVTISSRRLFRPLQGARPQYGIGAVEPYQAVYNGAPCSGRMPYIRTIL